MCGHAGHVKLYQDPNNADMFLCAKHMRQLYGDDNVPEQEPRDVPCFNISCDNKQTATEALDGAFCVECDSKIRKGICTSCDRKLASGKTADHYGHCHECSGYTDQYVCRGCQGQFEYPPVGPPPLFCGMCEASTKLSLCTMCGNHAEEKDENGWCPDCSPDMFYECKNKNDPKIKCQNHVTRFNIECADCLLRKTDLEGDE